MPTRPVPAAPVVYLTLLAVPAATAALAPPPARSLLALGAVLAAAMLIAWLERTHPYQPAWNQPRGDVASDLTHNLVNIGTNHLAVLLVAATPSLGFGRLALWPGRLPLVVQLALAIPIADLGLWLAHWASHRYDRLWRYHAVHHSPERLYLLNGERRHPLNHLLDVALGPGVLAAAGAGTTLLAVYGTVLVVHLAIQHANADLRLGLLRRLVSGPETHRLHHLRTSDAAVNLSTLTHLWDHAFGTFADCRGPVDALAVGLAGPDRVPASYVGQLIFPWRRSRPRTRLAGQGPGTG